MTSRGWPARVVVAAALGWFLALTVLPPRGGPVPALTRVFDPDLDFLLWPWEWAQADPRLVPILLMALVGALLVRAPRWLAVVPVVPVVVEAWQFLVPGLGQVASARDVAHAWIGLATGALVGAVLWASARLVDRLVRRSSQKRAAGAVRSAARARRTALAAGLTAVLLLGASSVWPRADGEAVAAGPTVGPQGALLGAEFHGAEVHGAQVHGAGGHTAGPGAAATEWLRAGGLPGEGTAYEHMAEVALWDLYLLTRDPLPPAGPGARWDYFWPRDGAFVAVALLRTGHAADAVAILEQQSQLYLDPLYGFDARYLLDGQRVIDDPRGAQVDGCGWVLWAIHEVTRTTDVPKGVAGLRDRCTEQVLRATGGGTRLPAPSPDYWERATFDRLLGASAPLLLGLDSAAADYRAGGEAERAESLLKAAESFRAEVASSFGPTFSRTTRGGGGLDAATAMLMPPFSADPLPGVREAWEGYQEGASRPGGGLAPGTDWKQDGVSWTPEVALVALTAAADAQTGVATAWLDWLDAHRAPWGSLPEKIGPDGTPGGSAPLGWTSSLVLLTLVELGL
ncbi:hypothetical protein [Ornithinimicrobium cryptoxanthini]|uniref:Glucoamylase n=1 Tax=Ornithinimicrobium cryptoxanthini TaxID=2934161 RepID=A0ABY4YLK9_9MICO|nr:hypothetical protein [Ornithinimicrobium cryptoxanthini]USQ77665.1 hypothetical protein NF557_07120 [Ornithinimicrobium cryptoxanthini]